jgi:hypothetical protein
MERPAAFSMTIRNQVTFPGRAMMTSENNASRMLTKANAFPCGIDHGYAFHWRRRCGKALILMCTGLAACTYRASDKQTVHTRATASETSTQAADEAISTALLTQNEASDTKRVSTIPLKEMGQANTEAGPRATAGDGMKKHVASSIARVVGDASVSLWPSPLAAAALVDDVGKPDTNSAAATSIQRAEAVVSDEGTGPNFSWKWFLAVATLIAAGAGGFGVARYRQRRMMTNREDIHFGDETLSQPNTPITVSAPSKDDTQELSELPALIGDGGELSVADVETGPIPRSRLKWSYQPADYEHREHWDVHSPVDFLPVLLPKQAMSEVSNSSFASEAEAAENRSQGQDEAAAALTLMQDDALSELFDQLESLALSDSSDISVLLIERGSDLPEVICTTGESLPNEVLQAWESTLRQALPGAQALTLPWLLINTLLLRADGASNRDAEALYAEAEEWIELGTTADQERIASWQARQIDIDLRRMKRQKGAARLLSLRAMQAHYASQLEQAEPPLLFAWIDVLTFWAQCQFGDAALARYDEAEAMCLRLAELPDGTDTAQRRRAEILRQRAAIEQGGARLSSLDTAQALVDALYERIPSADNALAIAITALARGNVLPPKQAKEAYSHALMYAFMAESEPRLRAEGLQCRLAVQWAYESLPGMAVQSDVAVGLAARLETLHVKRPDTLQRMAQTYVRSADFARACELCENAWRSGRATPALLATWQEACRQWAATSIPPDQHVVRQQTMRQLSIANAMH